MVGTRKDAFSSPLRRRTRHRATFLGLTLLAALAAAATNLLTGGSLFDVDTAAAQQTTSGGAPAEDFSFVRHQSFGFLSRRRGLLALLLSDNNDSNSTNSNNTGTGTNSSSTNSSSAGAGGGTSPVTGGVKCEPRHIHPADRCRYVREIQSCRKDDNLVHYLEIHYCVLGKAPAVSGCSTLALIALFFYVLATVAERFFCPVGLYKLNSELTHGLKALGFNP
jgi:hypothetical protein